MTEADSLEIKKRARRRLVGAIALALLAAIVTPQFSRADEDSRLANLKSNLLDVRAQIRLYRTQHGDNYPDLENFVEQMTTWSNARGQTQPERSPEYPFGPYLRSLPPNPYTGGTRVGNGPVGTSDWYYDPAGGLFRANHHPAFISQ